MKTLAVAKRLIKQIGGDKRSIGLMFVAPIFVMFLLNVIMTSATTKPTIDIVSAPQQFVDKLKEKANVVNVKSEHQAITHLKERKADAYINYSDNEPNITIEGTNPTITKTVMTTIQKAMFENITKVLQRLPNIPIPKQPQVKYLYAGEDFSTFNSLAPLLMGFFIFFFVFIIAGIAFLRERISGTLERVLATPVKRWQVVLGYFLGFGLFVAIQTILIQTFIVYGLNVLMRGSFWLVLLLNLLIATTALSLGTFLSAYARNEFQLFQFIPVIIVPQILFSGIFDLGQAPQWVKVLSNVFPLTYAAEGLRDIMIRGLGIEDILKEILVLSGFSIFFLILNTLALKKYRKA